MSRKNDADVDGSLRGSIDLHLDNNDNRRSINDDHLMHNKYYFNNCYFNDIHIDGFNHLSKHDDYWSDGRGKVHERLYHPANIHIARRSSGESDYEIEQYLPLSDIFDGAAWVTVANNCAHNWCSYEHSLTNDPTLGGIFVRCDATGVVNTPITGASPSCPTV